MGQRAHQRQAPRVLAATLGLVMACTADDPAQWIVPPGTPAVLVGAGDIGTCGSAADEATASLLDSIAGVVFTAGDNAYPDGAATDFASCYAPSWGRHKARTRPAPGNHDYHTANGASYYAYFGAAAGTAGVGYYSYDLGDWHIVSLNSNLSMAAASPQEAWLRADLAAHPVSCTLAYWHHPRFSSGEHGSDDSPAPLWQALYDAGADVVISGHDHTYERFAPQTPAGAADPARGIREFVVGTGGASLYDFTTIAANSEARGNTTHGVLKLSLRPSGYDWEFIPVAGGTFRDSGSGRCH
ncbi:MAG: metallophosphoesterase family protein [Gemmatimonadales bacterium]